MTEKSVTSEAMRAARQILEKFGTAHDHWVKNCAEIIDRSFPGYREPPEFDELKEVPKLQTLAKGVSDHPCFTNAILAVTDAYREGWQARVEAPGYREMREALEAVLAHGCSCHSASEDDWHSTKCFVPRVRAALDKARQEKK